MSDNLSPVIAPIASAPSATESSTGAEGSQDGQQAPAANGAAASASAHDHVTEVANPMVADSRSNTAHQQPQQPVGTQQPPQYIFGAASQHSQPSGANPYAHTPAFDPTAGLQQPPQGPSGPFEPSIQQLVFQHRSPATNDQNR